MRTPVRVQKVEMATVAAATRADLMRRAIDVVAEALGPRLVVVLLEGAVPLFEALALIDEQRAAETHAAGVKSAASLAGVR